MRHASMAPPCCKPCPPCCRPWPNRWRCATWPACGCCSAAANPCRANWSAASRRICPFRWSTWYGPTEATVQCAFHVCAPDDADTRDPVPLGRPLPGTTFHIDAADDADGSGELIIEGPGVASGYHGQPGRTAARFGASATSGRSYRSGDRVRRDAQGDYLFLGRSDNQVKLRGQRIELEEIEHALARSTPALRGAVAIVNEAQQIEVFLDIAAHDWDEAAARSAMAAALPGFMQPLVYTRLERFPVLPNGKGSRRRACAWHHARGTRGARGQAGGRRAGARNRHRRRRIRHAGPCRPRPGGARAGRLVRLVAAGRRRRQPFLPSRRPFAACHAVDRHGEPGLRPAAVRQRPVRPTHAGRLDPDGGSRRPRRRYPAAADGGRQNWEDRQARNRCGSCIPPAAASGATGTSPNPPRRWNPTASRANRWTTAARSKRICGAWRGAMRNTCWREQPQGPVVLCGYSFGGNVAYEMAVYLRSREA